MTIRGNQAVKVIDEKSNAFGAVLIVEKIANNGDLYLVGHQVIEGRFFDVAQWFEPSQVEVVK